ncbi:MAG: hypothetical protein AAB838_00385 [Patescibacteria group bacterium]
MERGDKDKRLIFRDFFVFSAVAWFAAGVITPISSPDFSTFAVPSVILSGLATIFLLRIAVLILVKGGVK